MKKVTFLINSGEGTEEKTGELVKENSKTVWIRTVLSQKGKDISKVIKRHKVKKNVRIEECQEIQ